MFPWEAEDVLRSCLVPVLVVGGSADIVTKPDASVLIANSAAAGRVQIVDGVNQLGPVDRADACHDAIASFAETLIPRRPVAV